jgi:hypothetical protein
MDPRSRVGGCWTHVLSASGSHERKAAPPHPSARQSGTDSSAYSHDGKYSEYQELLALDNGGKFITVGTGLPSIQRSHGEFIDRDSRRVGRVAIGCVSENTPQYLAQALRLVKSIRWFGGRLAAAECFVCVVDGVDARRFDARYGNANKLQFFDVPDVLSCDTLLLLDCDTVVVQDPTPYLSGEVFQAKMADRATVSTDVFRRLFDRFGLSLPRKQYRCNPTGTPTIWYCNSGVLVLPRRFAERLVPVWRRFTEVLLRERDRLERPYYCDQASLALAFAVESVPFRELPLSMNFPLHMTRRHKLGMDDADPVILHYHKHISADGFLLHSPSPGVERRVTQFNDRARDESHPHSERQVPALGRRLRRSRNIELPRPIFIVGCMRSGTTLLATLLGRSEGITYCPFELKHIWSEAGGVHMASPRTRESVCRGLGAEDVVDGQRENLIRAFQVEMTRHQAGKRRDAVFLNKNPHLSNKVALVRALFPDARFIWIHRRMPHVVGSLKVLFDNVCRRQRTWHHWPIEQCGIKARCWETSHFRPPTEGESARVFPGGDVRFLAEYWLETNHSVAQCFHALPDEQKLSVQLEDLVESPSSVLSRCLLFLKEKSAVAQPKAHFDLTRNSKRIDRLTVNELVDLLALIEERAVELNSILPGEGTRVASLVRQACDLRGAQ